MNIRDDSLTITLSSEEKQFIIQNAKKAFLSVTDYLILSALSVEQPCVTYPILNQVIPNISSPD